MATHDPPGFRRVGGSPSRFDQSLDTILAVADLHNLANPVQRAHLMDSHPNLDCRDRESKAGNKRPGLWETLGQKYPDLDEDEKKSFILSHFKISRQEEADYLGTTVGMVDKLRGKRRKKMEED